MATFRPFPAVRPLPEYAAQVAALPYDVMNSTEARAYVQGNPHCFMRIDRAEVNLPEGTNPYAPEVYAEAKTQLERLSAESVCRQDPVPYLYIYRQRRNGRSQTGLVGCASVDDYQSGTIKRHEFTRADKEQDRIRHVDTLEANTGPIFLTYRKQPEITQLVEEWQAAHKPVYDFVADGVAQTVWVIDCPRTIAQIQALFGQVESLYIADGHHRAASAVKVGLKRREQYPGYTGDEEFNFFLAVLFAQDELEIMDYNRVVKDLNGLTAAQFLEATQGSFTVEALDGKAPYKPQAAHTFGMFLEGRWYKLTAKTGSFPENDPVASLDVSILQDNLLAPILGIGDPRTDKRIDFVGGIRGLGELERRATADMALAFSLCPTTLDALMAIADAGEVMPPKSTWFEPKLLSGLFVHLLK